MGGQASARYDVNESTVVMVIEDIADAGGAFEAYFILETPQL